MIIVLIMEVSLFFEVPVLGHSSLPMDILPYITLLSLYHTILTFNDPKKEAF